MILTADADLAARLRLARNHGQTALYVHETLGCNWRITEMQAAMGRAQVAKLDAILARKRAVAGDLNRLLSVVPGVQTPVVRPDRDHVHMLYTIKFEGGRSVRDRVMEEAASRGIETRVYFPPVHRQPIFAEVKADLPVTDDLSGRILSLPVHSRLGIEEVTEIVSTVSEVVSRVGVGAPQ